MIEPRLRNLTTLLIIMIGLIRYDKIENRLEQIGLKLKALGIYFIKVMKRKFCFNSGINPPSYFS